MRARAQFLGILFEVLEREAVPYCILRNYKNIYEDASSDIDLIVEPEQLGRLRSCLAEAASRSGHFLVHQARYVNHSFVYGRPNGLFVRIDVETEVRWRFFPVLSAKAVLGLRRKHEGFYIPHPRHEAVILFVAAIWRGTLSERYRTQLGELYRSIIHDGTVDALTRTFEAAFGPAGRELAGVLALIANGKDGAPRLPAMRWSLISNAFQSGPNFRQFIQFLGSDTRRLIQRLIRPPGISLLFVSSAMLAEDPDLLFEKIEFLYPIQKSSRSIAMVPAGKGRRAKLDAGESLNRCYTLFKGGLFLRFYQVPRDEDIEDVIRAHRYWIYPSRAFVCSHNSAGRMWIRHAQTGSTARAHGVNEPPRPYDHLAQFIVERLESSGRAAAETPKNDSGSRLRPPLASLWPTRSVAFRRLAFSAAWLSLIATMSFLSLGFLKTRARSIAEDTLPGLTYAGAANANLAQAFNRTLLLLLTSDPAEQAKINGDIDVFSERTTQLLVQYKGSIYSNDDADLFANLLKCRTEYLRARQKTVLLAAQNERKEAASACQNELLPAYTSYKEAGDKLFDYNMREGSARGKSIMRLCTAAQCLVAAIAVGIFVVGFVLGLSQIRPAFPPRKAGH
jgi:hypothetical protein